MKKPFFILAILLSMTTIAQEFSSGESIEWQKIKLEEYIIQRVGNVLSKFNLQDKAHINILVEVNEKELSLTENSKPKPSVAKNMDEVPEGSLEDYFLLEKLGVAAPIYTDGDLNDKSFDLDGPKPINPLEVKEKNNLFKYLTTVDVQVYLDKDTVESSRSSIEALIKGLSFNFGKVKPTFKFEYIDISSIKSKDSAQSPWQETIFSFVKYLLLIVVAFAGLFLLLKKMESSLLPLFGSKNNNEESQSPDDPVAEEAPNASADSKANTGMATSEGFVDQSGVIENLELVGVKRFQTYLGNSVQDASLLVESWIDSNADIAKHALVALTQSLDTLELKKIFEHLSVEKRDQWKAILGLRPTKLELITSTRFISNEVINKILVPNAIQDQDTKQLLSSASLNTLKEIIEEDDALAVVLINIISPNMVSEIVKRLSLPKANALIKKGIDFSPGMVAEHSSRLKEALKAKLENKKKSMFTTRAIALLTDSEISIQNTLFETLALTLGKEELIKVATKNLPYELIEKLPPFVLKSAISKYTAKQRVILKLSLPGEGVKAAFKAVAAPEGTKSAEIFEHEEAQLVSNTEEMQRVEKNSSLISLNFLKQIRVLVQSNREYLERVEPSLEEWANEIIAKANFESNDESREAA